MLNVSLERLKSRLDFLSTLTDPNLPFTRRAFTARYLEGRNWLEREFQKAGLGTQTDAGGNLIGRLEGKSPKALVLGSHTDSVRSGGRFDGILGVLSALETVQTLLENGVKPNHSLEVVDFLSEEPSDYGGLSCVGSRTWAGTLSGPMLALENADGETLEQAMKRMGADLERVRSGPLRRPEELAAYLELHIEQGPTLEHAGIPIGVVTGIAGIERWKLSVLGQADHAGTTPMTLRKDALVGAAQVVLELNTLAGATPNIVATIGKLELSPGAANVVPERVDLLTDTRSIHSAALECFNTNFLERSKVLLESAGLGFSFERVSQSTPTVCNARVLSATRAGATRRGYKWLELPSGAGHDGTHLSSLCPVGMIFVPSVGGRSHTPEELTLEGDILAGTEVLLEILLELDGVMDGKI